MPPSLIFVKDPEGVFSCHLYVKGPLAEFPNDVNVAVPEGQTTKSVGAVAVAFP